jgi:hypothetical protein
VQAVFAIGMVASLALVVLFRLTVNGADLIG